MDCVSVITEIVVPLCSALLGGGLTLWGVSLIIKDQRKKEEVARKAAARPWIFSCEEHIPTEKKMYKMVPDSAYSEKGTIAGNIKNTDNGILILDCIKSEFVNYMPDGDNVVDKNSAFELVIFLKEYAETLTDLTLYTKDIYGNGYQYQLILKGNRFVLGECKER